MVLRVREPSESNLRRKMSVLCRNYRAILILTNRLNCEDRRKLDDTLRSLPQSSRRDIEKHIAKMTPMVVREQRRVGPRVGLNELERWLEPAPGVHLAYIAKVQMLRMFRHYERVWPIYADLPPHAYIGIDVNGVRDKAGLTVRLLEASLFEDMAALWNESTELAARPEVRKFFGNATGKRYKAMLRATAKAAFNLLEGYLNGLALDVLLSRPVTPAEKVTLEEWDRDRNKARSMSLRDKLLAYPRIAVEGEHTLLQENNCSEFAFMVEHEARVRHALVHPKSILLPNNPTESREQVYFELSYERVADLCDTCLRLIEKISEAMEHRYGNVSFWLTPRSPDGTFASEAFD